MSQKADANEENACGFRVCFYHAAAWWPSIATVLHRKTLPRKTYEYTNVRHALEVICTKRSGERISHGPAVTAPTGQICPRSLLTKATLLLSDCPPVASFTLASTKGVTSRPFRPLSSAWSSAARIAASISAPPAIGEGFGTATIIPLRMPRSMLA